MLHKNTAMQLSDYGEYLHRFYQLLYDLESKGNRVWPVERGREQELLDILEPTADDTERFPRSERADRLVKILMEKV
jgi:hypothetical protein